MITHNDPILSQALAPIAFAASDCRLVTKSPGCSVELWAASIKACRHGLTCDLFEDIYFCELNGTAMMLGMESETGLSMYLDLKSATRQQDFLIFLKNETQRENTLLGWMGALFAGGEYANEAKATAAYIAQRSDCFKMGIGYFKYVDHYELISIDAEQDGWLEDARNTLPFEKLGSKTAN
jgi:hypothetical protein